MQTNQTSRLAVAATTLIFLLMALVFFTPENSFAAGEWCTSPYVRVQDGATGTLPDPTNQFAIEYVNIGEPFVSCTTKRLTLVLKVPTMDPSGQNATVRPPPNAAWSVKFTVPASAVTKSNGAPSEPVEVFFQYDTTFIPTGIFNYGWADPISGFNCSQCSTSCAVTGTVTANGTITMNVPAAGLTFGSCDNTGAGYDVTISSAAWQAGLLLSNIQGTTERFLGAAGTGFSLNDAATDGTGEYALHGNLSCANPPVAALSATPTSGNAPLTVNFTATGTIPAGACGPVSSYLFDFGDGQTATQATPTISHTYTNGGVTYPARVRVVSPSGTSAFAQVNITVNSAGPPQLSSVVSRKTHGGAGNFDIVLPQPPAARTIECRSGGATNDYKLVFTFLNNLTSVGSASVTTGTGSVSSTAMGPNSNQYTVNLTGVTSGQSTTVTLTNAADSTGANGPVVAIMGVLVGDTTNDASVNSADIAQTKSKSGQAVDATNFRQDVTVDGSLNSADIALTKSKSGTALP